ncbi:MAG: phosphatase PAP2 family protein [Nitrospinae bacterium]|nr:phosphatase PAP2 family protein [Nitrospinota bacterium]
MKAALVLGTTGAFFAADDDIREFAQDNRSEEKDRLADVFTPFGDGRYIAPALAVYYLQGYAFENQRSKRAALLGLESFAVTGLFTTVLKYGTGRDRPNTGNNAESWNGPGSIESYAFPSGHTSTAFAIAAAFATEYQDEPLVPPLAYGIATMTGLSRINDNKHWASDVFFGAALGYFTSKTIYKLRQNKEFGRFALYPKVTAQETGLTFAYRY